MDKWELRVAKYIGKKLDKAIDEWLGLFVVIAALALAAWWKVGAQFADWLDKHPGTDALLFDPWIALYVALPALPNTFS